MNPKKDSLQNVLKATEALVPGVYMTAQEALSAVDERLHELAQGALRDKLSSKSAEAQLEMAILKELRKALAGHTGVVAPSSALLH